MYAESCLWRNVGRTHFVSGFTHLAMQSSYILSSACRSRCCTCSMLLVVVRFGRVIFGSIEHFVCIVHVDDKQAISDENCLKDQNYLVEGQITT